MIKIRNIALTVIVSTGFLTAVYAQAQKRLSLQEAIVLARLQSVDAAVALNELKTSYWEYRTFRADLLPEVNFTGVVPSYKRSYSSLLQSDGSYIFVRNNTLNMQGELSIDQNIWLTGGQLSLTSSLDYFKQLTTGGARQFMSVPVSLQLTQPVFGVNSLKWNRRIQPIRYEEAKAAYVTATERVTLHTISYYFSLLLSAESLKIAQQNLKNAEHMYQVAQARRDMGQISENELLQLKLSALKAQAALTDAESTLNSSMFTLRAHLDLGEDVVIVAEMPDEVPVPRMDFERVLDKALENHSFSRNIRRRQLESDYAVAAAKGNLRSINLFASIGYTGSSHELRTSYQDLIDNQVVQVGVKIPLLDWGKRRGNVKVAESNRDVVRSRIRQEELNFNQDIFLLTERFNNQAAQLHIAREADLIAQKRYDTSVEAFLIGKINTLDLADAQTSKDSAREKLISEIYMYWYYYYQIRSLTLWDFEVELPLAFDEKELVR